MHILFLSSEPYIDGNGSPLSSDDRLLSEALMKRGTQVSIGAWESLPCPHLSREHIDLVLVRSAWTYHLAPERFLAMLEDLAAEVPLRNTWPLIRWNVNKYHYVRDLAQAGFPIIPTIWLHPSERRPLSQVLAATGWRRAVLKPAISANSFGTCLFSCEKEPMRIAELHLDCFLRAGRSMMLQPYLPAVEAQGEHSYVFVAGSLSHAYLKKPFHTLAPGKSPALALYACPPCDEILLATSLMRWIEGRFGQEAVLFGRVDLVRDEHGELRLMELELIEPLLHLEYGSALHTLTDLILSQRPSPVAPTMHHPLQTCVKGGL